VNTSWKTTLGGSLSALGTALMGIGVVPQLGTNVHSNTLTNVALAGFICSAAGTFFSHLFAADADATAAAISGLQVQTSANSTSILTGSPTPTAMAVQATVQSAVPVAVKPVVPVPSPLAPPHA
jgi:hypothetical protein